MTEKRYDTTQEACAEEKYRALQRQLGGMGKLAIAFSGGVDSAFLLKAAHDLLGENVTALTASSRIFPERESKEAKEFCETYGIRQIICEVDELKNPVFTQNPPDRCYWCKRDLFTAFLETAARQELGVLAEGSNVDDCGDYRPGLRAIAELGVKSPLREAGLTKAEIRLLSKKMGLATWEKPSYACLASRFAYGETITREQLAMVERAEAWLMNHGFVQMRVRIHGGNLARIELPPQYLARMAEPQLRARATAALKEIGFSYVTLDLQGYRVGSMNETLDLQ